jgi:hypothetical protein
VPLGVCWTSGFVFCFVVAATTSRAAPFRVIQALHLRRLRGELGFARVAFLFSFFLACKLRGWSDRRHRARALAHANGGEELKMRAPAAPGGRVLLAAAVLVLVVAVWAVQVADAQKQLLGEHYEKKEGRCAQDNPHPKPFKVPSSLFYYFNMINL